MHEPGLLAVLPEAGLQAWRSTVERLVAGTGRGGTQPVRSEPSTETSHLIATGWTGLPQRVVACLGRQAALALLDWRGEDADEGRRRLQEEYVEWRTVRDASGRVRRVELTTELPEYWTVAAAHAPSVVLATVAGFAHQESVDPAAVFGRCDPFAASTTAQDRADAFAETMLAAGATSPYNSGATAICCMIQPTNTLDGLVSLAGAALQPCAVTADEGGPRPCLSADALLPLMPGLAQHGRASDPLLVERLARLAWDGRVVAFDDPVGVYIEGIEHSRLRTPAGAPVPPEWFRFSRGAAQAETRDGHARWQRVAFEVPADVGYAVGDLVDVATEDRIDFGGQVAELLQIVVYLRVSDRGQQPVDARAVSLATANPAADACADVLAHRAEQVA